MADALQKVKALRERAAAYAAEKRPRQYADEILALPVAQQEQALLAVPEHLRALTRDHITSYHEVRAALVRTHVEHILEQRSPEGRRAALAKVPAAIRDEVEGESRRRYGERGTTR